MNASMRHAHATGDETMTIEAHFGYFDNGRTKKWVASLDGEVIHHQGNYGHQIVTTFTTREAAIAAAKKIQAESLTR